MPGVTFGQGKGKEKVSGKCQEPFIATGDSVPDTFLPGLFPWIKRDSLPVRTLNPNAYVYCANGPTNFTDPNGQEIYDVPTGTQPNPGSIAGYGGATAPRADLGPKIGLDDFNQPSVELLDSVNPEFQQGNIFNEEDSLLIVEFGELVADIAGIVDPSPTCDIIGAICAKGQGDNVGTTISAASIVPGLDIAKLGKIAKKVKVIEKLIDRAKHSDEFLTVIRPALEYIRKKIADGIDCVEEGLKKTLQDLKDKLDDLLGKKIPNSDLQGPLRWTPKTGRADKVENLPGNCLSGAFADDQEASGVGGRVQGQGRFGRGAGG